MRSNNMWRRFFAMAAAVVLAVAAMVPAVAMADVVDDLASTSPAHEKTLKDNGDGTYDLTLSVSGDAEQTDRVKPVDIVLVVDSSTSMNWKIDGIGSKTHMRPHMTPPPHSPRSFSPLRMPTCLKSSRPGYP